MKARIESLKGFALDAEVTLSELRQEELLTDRLHTFHRLRLRRRNEVLGVIVEAQEWRALEQHIRDLEAQIEHHEDQAVARIIAQREPNAEFVSATPQVMAEIDRQYQELISE